ncbi:hypothetical protein HID58_005879 [Brassica napus]|uniref:Uncharacterized protein n=1 Tax=Brassica napus TaxID=3708 RepID=A0ABQ8EAF9_BRANA|nr:hypothetical protein HID58_005879 [Brassica napus]
MLFSTTPTNGNNLIGIDQHMDELYPLLDLNSNQGVRVIGIWGRGSNGRSVLARHVYENISHNFDAHCLLEDVRRRHEHVGLEEPTYRPMDLPGINFFFTLKYLLALLCDRGQLRERLEAMIYIRYFCRGFQLFWFGEYSYQLSSSLTQEHVAVYFHRHKACLTKNISDAFESVLCRGTNLAMEWLGCLHVRSGLGTVSQIEVTDADKSEGCCSVHLIDGDGIYNVSGIDHLIKEESVASPKLLSQSCVLKAASCMHYFREEICNIHNLLYSFCDITGKSTTLLKFVWSKFYVDENVFPPGDREEYFHIAFLTFCRLVKKIFDRSQITKDMACKMCRYRALHLGNGLEGHRWCKTRR